MISMTVGYNMPLGTNNIDGNGLSVEVLSKDLGFLLLHPLGHMDAILLSLVLHIG